MKQIFNMIDSLNNDTAPGLDNINSELLKTLHNYLVEPLTHISNLYISTGIYPSSSKIVESYQFIKLVTNEIYK